MNKAEIIKMIGMIIKYYEPTRVESVEDMNILDRLSKSLMIKYTITDDGVFAEMTDTGKGMYPHPQAALELLSCPL